MTTEGAPITLTDGRTVRLRYDARALVELAVEFGGLDELQRAFADAASGRGEVISVVTKWLAAGLKHEHLTEEDLLDLLDVSDLNTYGAAANYAFTDAFDGPDQQAIIREVLALLRRRSR